MQIEITLDQFVNQWVPKDPKATKAIPEKMTTAISNFTTAAGDHALTCFKSSFEKGGFCGETKWEPRKNNRWGKKLDHPVLYDFGKLHDGIVADSQSTERGHWNWPGDGNKRIGPPKEGLRRHYTYKISTTEIAIPSDGTPKRRGKVTRDKYNYAAVHNTPPGISPFTVNQHSDRKPIQRQFIGHNTNVLNHINDVLLPKYFNEVLYSYYA